MDTKAPQKPIHSLILDTGPLIKNAVSISTIISSAEEIFTTPAIISEIRDEATRSRVQTTLMPFLKVRTPTPASYDAVISFSKKTGDYPVLSRQDLGILALAYQVHCERNGGPWGLREAPKQPLKVKPGEEKKQAEIEKNDQVPTEETPVAQDGTAEKPGETEEADNKEEESWTEVKVTKPKKVHKKKEKKRLARELEAEKQSQDVSTSEEPQPAEPTASEEQAPAQASTVDAVAEKQGQAVSTSEELLQSEPISSEEQSTAQASIIDVAAEKQDTVGGPDKEPDMSEQRNSQTMDTPENVTDVAFAAHKEQQDAPQPEEAIAPAHEISVPQESVESQVEQAQEAQEQPSTTGATHKKANSISAQDDLTQDLSSLNLTTPPSPPFTDESDSDSDWITPENLASHIGPSTPSTPSTPLPQLPLATMTTDFAMQNVLLQMNLSLLSPNMQRISRLTSKVLRCHACFLIVHDVSKQFCPRCGGASLLRVNCSTNSKGEFRLHLAKNYQYNKRGDKYSIPKPIAGTANGKWNGIGGGKGGWGRDLVLSEDQKEYTGGLVQEGRQRAKDLMDEDYLPGILTGDRASRQGGRVKVGAGKNVNAKRRA